MYKERSNGKTACGGYRSPWLVLGLLLEIPTRRSLEQRGVLTWWRRDAVTVHRSREHASTFLDVVGLVLEPRALELGRLLGEEVAEAPPDLRLLRRTEGEAARGMARESPLRR